MITISESTESINGYYSVTLDWPTRPKLPREHYLLFKDCGHFCYGYSGQACCACSPPENRTWFYEACPICPSGPREGPPSPKGKS